MSAIPTCPMNEDWVYAPKSIMKDLSINGARRPWAINQRATPLIKPVINIGVRKSFWAKYTKNEKPSEPIRKWITKANSYGSANPVNF